MRTSAWVHRPHLSHHLATYSSHSSLIPLSACACACVCVCVRFRMGPFCAAPSDVFVREGLWECVPQTNERGEEIKRAMTSRRSFSEGQYICILLTLKFLLRVCDVCV